MPSFFSIHGLPFTGKFCLYNFSLYKSSFKYYCGKCVFIGVWGERFSGNALPFVLQRILWIRKKWLGSQSKFIPNVLCGFDVWGKTDLFMSLKSPGQLWHRRKRIVHKSYHKIGDRIFSHATLTGRVWTINKNETWKSPSLENPFLIFCSSLLILFCITNLTP